VVVEAQPATARLGDDERCWPWLRSARRSGAQGPGSVRFTSEDHRATTFERFFDLVYVFAVTQVTGDMAEEHSAHGLLQGLLLLTLLWWTWSGHTWLGNQARADEGLLRAGIPEAWHDAPGGLNGPLVLVGAYLLVRCVHLTLYAVAATGDPGLRRQVAITWLPTVAGAALLGAGTPLGGWTQTLFAPPDRTTRAVHHPGHPGRGCLHLWAPSHRRRHRAGRPGRRGRDGARR